MVGDRYSSWRVKPVLVRHAWPRSSSIMSTRGALLFSRLAVTKERRTWPMSQSLRFYVPPLRKRRTFTGWMNCRLHCAVRFRACYLNLPYSTLLCPLHHHLTDRVRRAAFLRGSARCFSRSVIAVIHHPASSFLMMCTGPTAPRLNC